MPRAALTEDQVREARLSLESSTVVADRFGVKFGTIEACRAGATYRALKPDEQDARVLRYAQRKDPGLRGPRKARVAVDVAPPFPTGTLLVGRVFPLAGLADQDRQEQRDAAHECPHGSLPHDRVIVCDCWVPVAPVVRSRITWVPQRRKWRAGLVLDGQLYHVGAYDSPEAAESGIQAFVAAKTNPNPNGGNNGSNHRERVERFRRQAVVDGHGRPADDPAVLA